jgi:chlorite dismutase
LSLNGTALCKFSSRPYSFLSVVELSLYEAAARAGTEDFAALMSQPFVRRRLFPAVPQDKPYISFYPMNKRRGEAVNWYTESMDERRRMMASHGTLGRHYTDRIQQMITGSMGLDDWEWGVTLYASDPIALKKLVTAMRFDEVSAKYAEFGPFYTGIRLTPESFASTLRSSIP